MVHHSNRHKLYRVCGETLSAAGRVSYGASSGRGLLKRVFGVEVEHDNAEIHPPKYCHRCRGVVYHATKKGGTDAHIHVVIFQWSPHSPAGCNICMKRAMLSWSTHTQTHTHTHKTSPVTLLRMSAEG